MGRATARPSRSRLESMGPTPRSAPHSRRVLPSTRHQRAQRAAPVTLFVGSYPRDPSALDRQPGRVRGPVGARPSSWRSYVGSAASWPDSSRAGATDRSRPLACPIPLMAALRTAGPATAACDAPNPPRRERGTARIHRPRAARDPRSPPRSCRAMAPLELGAMAASHGRSVRSRPRPRAPRLPATHAAARALSPRAAGARRRDPPGGPRPATARRRCRPPSRRLRPGP